VSGILLGYDNIKLKKSTGLMYNDQPHIHIDIEVTFYIFCPTPATFLLGRVNKISERHVGVLGRLCIFTTIIGFNENISQFMTPSMLPS
jgi:hypothetical protein